jgi:AcrR family transcriptional regulator
MAVGRPREFNPEKALDKALTVFWRKGYEGASLPELTAAMEINRPSLYATFGNKEELFRKALYRYAAGPAAYVQQALEAPTARAVAEALFRGAIQLGTDPRNPGGCMAVHAALACSKSGEAIREALIAHRAAGEAAICSRFKRAKREGDLPPHANPADLARFVSTFIYGMAVQAASGASRKDLERVARLALDVWPEPKRSSRRASN